ncbi:MAG: response regulator [Candidatus Wallbacteria bacterium]|nr:response regulator [Candidatus Wallbacteria bacterium]
MITVAVDTLKPGAVLARPVMYKGHVILDSGTVLTEEYIRSLKKREITQVFLNEEPVNEPEIESVAEDPAAALGRKLSGFTPTTSRPEQLFELIQEAGRMADCKLVPVLTGFLKYRDSRIDQTLLRLTVLDALMNMPDDPRIDNICLVQLSLSGDVGIKAKLVQRLTRFPKEQNVYSLLLKIPEIPLSLIPQVRDMLAAVERSKLETQLNKVLSGEKDATRKKQLLKLLEEYFPRQTMEGMYRKYLGMEMPVRAPVTEREKICSSPDAAETLHEKPVRGIEISEGADLTKVEIEERVAEPGDAVINPRFVQVLDLSSQKHNLKKIFQENYDKSIEETTGLLADFRTGKRIVEDRVEKLVNSIICQVREHPEHAFGMVANNTIKNYLLSHSLNVTYLSVLIGTLCGLDENRLVVLGCSAILHDVGMVKMDKLLWNEPRRLTEVEIHDIRKHTIYGIDSLAMSTRFPREIGFVAYQHHERIDGSGYPKEKKAHLISECSRIVGISDVVGAMLSRRSYRDRLQPAEMFHHLVVEGKERFDQKYVELLLDFYAGRIDAGIKEKIAGLKNSDDAGCIAVVDDNKDIADMIVRVLKGEGLRAVAMTEPAKVLDSMQNLNPHMMILDLMMPGIDGFEIFDRLRQNERWESLPILVLTARKDRQAVERLKELGVSAYLTKPFCNRELLDRVKKILINRVEGARE